MIYADVCTGISAATLAWRPLGWSAAFYSEIDPFACAVLDHHYPEVPNHGDIAQWRGWPDADLDVLVGGTPCQGFSIAGKRKGLDDPRSQLAAKFLDVAGRYGSRWIVWENVPGARSTWTGRADGAADMGRRDGDVVETNDLDQFCAGLVQCGYGLAIGSLDLQYLGVPQRRERVVVVGYLGDWRPAAAVLFDREGLRGLPAPSRKAGKAGGPARADGGGAQGGGRPGRVEHGVPVAIDDTVGAITDGAHLGGGHNGQDIYTGRVVPVAFSIKDYGEDVYLDVAPPLRAMNNDAGRANAGGQIAVAFAQNSRDELRLENGDGSVAGPVTCGGGKPGQGGPVIAFDLRGREEGARFEGPHDTVSVRATDGGSSRSYVAGDFGVRRLTPRECERLFGMPDDYTRISWRGKPPARCPDGLRFKALGNSIGVPMLHWLGRRIQLCDELIDEIGWRPAP